MLRICPPAEPALSLAARAGRSIRAGRVPTRSLTGRRGLSRSPLQGRAAAPPNLGARIAPPLPRHPAFRTTPGGPLPGQPGRMAWTAGPGLTGRGGADPGPHPGHSAAAAGVRPEAVATAFPVTDEPGPFVYAGSGVGAADPAGTRGPAGTAGASTKGARRLPRPSDGTESIVPGRRA